MKIVFCAECGHTKKAHQAGSCSYSCSDEDMGEEVTMSPECYCKKWIADDGMWVVIKKSGSWSMINYTNSACSGGIYEQLWAMEEGLA